MGCTDCIKAYELIGLPVGSSKDAVKSARKAWSKNLHPDIWQNRPGWRGAATQLTNINVAIDHVLRCNGTGSSSYVSSGASPKSASEAEAFRQAMEAIRKAKIAGQTQAEAVAVKTRTKGRIIFAGACVLFVLPLFLFLKTTLFSSGQVDASNPEPASFPLQASDLPQADASPSAPMQAAPAMVDGVPVEKDVEQPEAIAMTSTPTPVEPAAQAAPAPTTSQTSMPATAQLQVQSSETYCGVNVKEGNVNCQKWRDKVSVSPRPAYVPVTTKVMDHLVFSSVATTIRNQYGVVQRTAPVGYAAVQQAKAQTTRRATTLILRNGPTIYVRNVWYSGELVMFTMPDGSRRFVGLEQVNFRSTIQANQQIGVAFHRPPGYPGD